MPLAERPGTGTFVGVDIPEPAMELRDQLQLTLGDSYAVGRELGGGGMSRVFLAEDVRLGRTVVVKVLAPELAGTISTERFEREIRVAASLQQANIVPLLTAGETEGLPYFTMPYVEGQSLRMRLASGQPVSIGECLSVLRDVTRALGYAHERGVVHRDIKPDNVLLSRGAAEVTDFGIAKALDAARLSQGSGTLTQLGSSVGTPAYMSPEQAAGDPDLDHRADIYAVGVLAYEMIAGRPPFTGTPQAVMAAQVSAAPPPLARADLPPSLQRMVMKCLAKDPAMRYQTADELLGDIEAVATPSGALPSATRARPSRIMAFAGVAAALLALAWFGTGSMRRERWVRAEAIPRIKQHAELTQYDSAWMLMQEAQAIMPHDSALTALLPLFTRKSVLHSAPEGAKVFRAPFDDSTHWVLIGTTPTDSVLLPLGLGRVRVEKPGYRTQFGLMGVLPRTFFLDPATSPDSDMAHVPGGKLGVFLVGLEGRPPLAIGDFLMDRHEVTNRQFKAFMDAGGYSRREFWPAEMAAMGGWDALVSRFKDRTARPGPATWEAGEFPTGQGDLPVGGVSWYEAMAYAKYADKSLPTIYHWARAASVATAKYVVPGSNFDGKGPVRGGTSRGMSLYGVFDLAGNVREWCINDASGGERYILGGGWTDPPYGFTDAYAQAASDRAEINGIRLVRYLRTEPALAQASAPTPRAFRDYAHEKPVAAPLFESYRHIFDYDRTALNAKVDIRDTTNEDWVRERVSFDAAYGGERMMAWVYIPRRAKPPYQPVVVFPGSNVISLGSSTEGLPLINFIAKGGRVMVLPILKSTFERQDSLHSDLPDSSIFWRDHVVMWVKDMRRTLDYLSSRPDMDSTRFGYFGGSWGSNQAPVVLASEPRFKSAVLYVAGLTMERGRPEVDPLNYLPYVTVPVLMLDGKYDFYFPVELSQKPFFQWIGTAAPRKKYLVYEGGHDVPRVELIKESLAWWDQYLGPVR